MQPRAGIAAHQGELIIYELELDLSAIGNPAPKKKMKKGVMKDVSLEDQYLAS